MITRLNSVSSITNIPLLKIQNYFFDYPNKELSLNDICSALKISKTTANKTVNVLVREGFLDKQVLGKLWRIKCNLQHKYNTTRKIPYHMNLIYEIGLLEAIDKMTQNFNAIILFGSYRKGDDNDRSDIDIALEIIGNENTRIVDIGNIKRFGYRYNVPVRLHIFSRKKVDTNLFANIANGILLYGFLEVRP